MRYYQYAGNPSCGCCDDPCPLIQISRCNFNEYCNTSGEEWREHDYGTQSRSDKQCELWYTQSATISLDSSKTGTVDGTVWIEGFGAGAWDDKYRGSSQTRADGDTFVKYHTLTLGNKTIVYSITTVWLYDSGASTYRPTTTYRVYIDNILYWVVERIGEEDTSSEGDFFYSWVIYRRGNNIDVYIDGGSRWVWSFTDASSNTFTYAFQAIYTGSTKYICVDPNLTWRTVKYKPDPDCVYYPPGTLTQTEINDIEERQRLSFENNDECRYTSGTFCPVFSPNIGIRISSKPGEYSACPSLYRPVYVTGGRYSTYQNWEIQKTSYCIDSGIARRINNRITYASPLRAVNNCSELPYGYTIEYWLYATEAAAVSIITAPANGTATIVEENDTRRIRYTAPASLPTGTCIDWLEYQLIGKYGETSRGVLKFKLYNEEYTQDTIWEDYLLSPSKGIVEQSDYYQQVLMLEVNGERANIGEIPTSTETQWHVELYGLLPHGIKKYTELSGVTFSYLDGISSWFYQYGDVGDLGDVVRSDNPLTPTDPDYQYYTAAKAMLEAITASITLRGRERTTDFIVSNNNILDSCSTSIIDSTTTTVSVKLVKSSTITGVEIDSQQLQDQTLVVDWGISPEESPMGLLVPTDQGFSIDVSQYSSRFYINSVSVSVRIRIGQITAKTSPENGVLWTGNGEVVTAEISTSTSITYF